MKKFWTWTKKNWKWLGITGGLSAVVLAQAIVLKKVYGVNESIINTNEDLLNMLESLNKDVDPDTCVPPKYVNVWMEKLAEVLASDLENSMDGEGVSKENVESICWWLRNDWHNYIYD